MMLLCFFPFFFLCSGVWFCVRECVCISVGRIAALIIIYHFFPEFLGYCILDIMVFMVSHGAHVHCPPGEGVEVAGFWCVLQGFEHVLLFWVRSDSGSICKLRG